MIPGVKCIVIESRAETQGWREEVVRRCCLMDANFLFGMMKKFWAE
jgi:hypothetical protein